MLNNHHQRPEIEQIVIAAALLQPGSLKTCDIRPEDFVHPAHKQIWARVLAQHASGQKPDPALIMSEDSGLTLALSDALAAEPVPGNMRAYEQQLKRTTRSRTLHQLFTTLRHQSESGTSPDEIVESAFAGLMSLAQEKQDTTKHVADFAAAALEGKTLAEIPSCMAFGGFPVGCVTIIGGRPSQGKSSLMKTALFNAAKSGFGVHLFSIEDTGQTLAARLLAELATVDLERVLKGKTAPHEKSRLQSVTERLRGMRFIVDDASGLTPADVERQIVRHKERNGTNLVGIDFVQLMRGEGRSRYEQMSYVVEALQDVAKRQNVALVLAAQLSRAAVEGDLPELHHLKETGSMEQVANKVLLVHRPGFYETDPSKKQELESLAYVRVAKNKNGPIRLCEMEWIPEIASYRDAGVPF